jgi:mannan endo-1,4-beta-mannosidase
MEPPVGSPAGEARRLGLVPYLQQLSGSRVLTGQHNRQPLADPSRWTHRAHRLTGRWPALWGSDFEFEPGEVAAREAMVTEAIAQWRAGSLVCLGWHVCPPTTEEPCDWDRDIRARLSEGEWGDLLQPGSRLHEAWLRRLDRVVPHLRRLLDAGVEVLWRPLHELNETSFWWGGRRGSGGSRDLYLLTHRYLQERGLTGLTWVFSVDDWCPAEEYADYDPGPEVAPVVSLDVYRQRFPSAAEFAALRAVAGLRPMVLGEVATVPSVEDLAAQPQWVGWMVWAEYLEDPVYNDPRLVRNTYAASRSVSRRGRLRQRRGQR